ncbi:MAG: MBL fold metallo-hydrolase [Nitriliruptorales bacterium]
MRVHLCGVRGSSPVSGPEFVRYGGATSCVAIAADGGAPTLVLDAGTGISRVSQLLDGAPFAGSIVLGHLHWDHVSGLPFFGAADHPDARVDVHVPAQEIGAEELLSRVMSPPFFPVGPGELQGEWSFHDLDEGETTIEGFHVLAREIPHKGGRTFGYRVSDGRASVAYLSDHHPVGAGSGPHGDGENHEAAKALVADVDLLIHDAQYTRSEFAVRGHFGHSTIDYAIGLAEACGVRHLLLFHHDPERSDVELDGIVDRYEPSIRVSVASEGAVYELPHQ